MELNFVMEMFIPIVMAICLVVGFLFKKFMPADNKWIPVVVTVLGAVLACVNAGSISLEVIGSGFVTGLASTGLYEVFAQMLGIRNEQVVSDETAMALEAKE